jgi:MFS family permease
MKMYWLLSALFSLTDSFFFGTYAVFLTTRGMNLLEINMVNAVFMASVFFLEIPTGAYADIFGRKKSVVLSCFIFSLSMLIYFFSHNFWLFVLAEAIGAVGVAFGSGAMEAWAVDSLKFHGYDGGMENVFRRENQFRQAAIIIGSITGGYIGSINIALPWLFCSIGSALVGLFAMWKMKEVYFCHESSEKRIESIGKIAKDSVQYGLKNRSVFFAIGFGGLLLFSTQAFNMQWSLVFHEKYDFPVSDLGWIFAGISLSMMLGNQISVWAKKLFRKEKDAFVLSQSVTAVGMIAASMMSGARIFIPSFFFQEFGRGIIAPLKQSYINHRIPSEKRATILSFDSMIGKGFAALGLVGSGYLANTYSISLAWLVSGIVLSIAVVVFAKLKNGE